MKNIMKKSYYVFSLFLALVVSGCSASSAVPDAGPTSALNLSLEFPESNQSGRSKGLNALEVDPSIVVSLTLIVTNNNAAELTSKTISLTTGALVSISFDVPLGLDLTITAILSNAQGDPIFKGKSIPLDFTRGISRSLTITMDIFNALLGSWRGLGINGEPDLLITFINDKEYFMAQDLTGDPSCNSGMEHGFYTWHPATKALNITSNMTDTTGQCGLHAVPTEAFTVKVENDTFFLSTVNGEIGSFSRVKSISNPLVGSWFFGTQGQAESRVLTFIDDLHYMVASDTTTNGGIGTTTPGMERGTYTLSATGAISVSVITNTNGDELFSDPSEQFNLSVSGNSMTMEITDNIGTNREIWTKVPLVSPTQDKAQDLPNKIIVIDGNNGDWGDVSPVSLDPGGDQIGNTSTDLTKVAIAKSGNSIALLMEVSGNIAKPHTPSEDFSHYAVGFHFFDNDTCTGNDKGFFIVNDFTSSLGENLHRVEGHFGDETLSDFNNQQTNTAFLGNTLETSFSLNLLPTNKGQFFSLNPFVHSFGPGSSPQHDQADTDICFRLPQ